MWLLYSPAVARLNKLLAASPATLNQDTLTPRRRLAEVERRPTPFPAEAAC